ncbi:hypothetical protein [Brevibacillus nitrificans]|nr:hypothetical protein [Brevibacillus nitrificans]
MNSKLTLLYIGVDLLGMPQLKKLKATHTASVYSFIQLMQFNMPL